MHDREEVLAREVRARKGRLDREQEQKAGWAREEVQGKEEMLDREEGPVKEEMVAREEDQREVLAWEQELFRWRGPQGDTGG